MKIKSDKQQKVMMNNDHSLLITHSGKSFDVRKMTADDVYLEDIAHHLAKICRYGGSLALDVHYSVAQHSCLLASYALYAFNDSELALALLFHDASEAYLGDITAGLKSLLPDYKGIEQRVQGIIEAKYGVDSVSKSALIKALDTRILLNEVKAFLPQHLELFRQTHPRSIPLHSVIPTNEMNFKSDYFKNLFLVFATNLGVHDNV